MNMLYRYRNNKPIERHTDDVHPFNWSDGIGLGDFQKPAGDSNPQPAPKPAKPRLPSEMEHGDGDRNEAVLGALQHMHERGHIDIFKIMANVLAETDEDEHEHPELRDLHSMAHHAADGLHTGEGYH